MSKLPSGWVLAHVADLAEVASGQTPKGIDNQNSKSGVVPWFRVSDMNHKRNGQYLSVAKVRLSMEVVTSLRLHIRPEGTIVFPKRGGAIATNKKRLLAQPSAYDLNTMGLIPNEEVAEHLWWWFQTVDLGALDTGTSVPQINHGDIGPLEIPVPPRAEQRRIVAKIESLFERSQRAKEALGRIPALLDKLRQSILAAAFRGDLTADWRAQNPDVEPADKLLQRIRTERRTRWEQTELAKLQAKGKEPKDDKWKAKYKAAPDVVTNQLPYIPKGWTWASLGEVCTKISDGEHISPKTTTSGVPLLSAKDIREEAILLDSAKFVTASDAARFRERCDPKPGDLLVVSRGATIGRSTLVATDVVFCLMGSVILLRASERMLPEFLGMFLRSSFAMQAFVGASGTTAQQAIYLRDIAKCPVPIAPLAEQKRLAVLWQQNLSRISEVENRIGASTAVIERMNSSILAKAFRGELVPQDPNDEPASVLLDRIRAAREAAKPVKPAKKTRTKRRVGGKKNAEIPS